MKDLRSMSGLLPAQFRTDPASAGIGWTTINQNPIEREAAEVEYLERFVEKVEQTPTETIGAIDCEIRVGDWVQVLPDYDHDCGDKLNPGGIYVVRKIEDCAFKLSEQLVGAWIGKYWIKKIDLRVGMRVKTLGEITPPGLDCSVSGSGQIRDLNPSDEMPYRVFMYRDHCGFNGVLWFEEGTLTLDD